ncbi:MAG: hypothetical protein LH470_00480 [Lysobacter sp.]|nr:hypothetical protein [Lysobacter sp.]
MKMRLLLLLLACAAALSGCVTPAGYRGYGGGYYGSSSVDHRYGRSYPNGYYGDEYAYRYDRYGRPYVSYGYGDPYGSYGYGYGSSYGSYGYGYPYGYYGGNSYNYYYSPQYNPNPGNGAGSNNPPPVTPPRSDLILRRRPTVFASPQALPPPDQTLRDFTRARRVQQAMPAPSYEQDPRIRLEPRFRPEPSMAMPRMRQSVPESSGESLGPTPNVSSDPVDEVRARKGGSGR